MLVGLSAGLALALALPSSRSDAPDLSRYRFSPISLAPSTEREPAWSPDGKRIVYLAALDGVLQVMTRTMGGSQAAQLTHRSRNAADPFWSADGSTIYFSSRTDDGLRPALWSVNATGAAPELVIEGATSAAMHPDGRTFAFLKEGKLWIGEDPRLSDAPAREFGSPAPERPTTVHGFSPDGSKLAVTADGNGVVLAYPSGAAVGGFPSVTRRASWMPDNRRVVVSGFLGSNRTLLVADTETRDVRTLYTSAYTLADPAVSPDGKRVAFSGGDVTWDLIEVDVSSGRVRTMPSAGGVSWWPAWAPSGTHYAFVSDKVQRPAILDINSESAGAFSRVLVDIEGDGSSLEDVRWSPDGNRFSFTIGRPTGDALMLANVAGSPPQAVDDEADASRQGVWSPDGEWLVYLRRVGTEDQLVKLKPGSRNRPEVLKRASVTDSSGASRAPVDWSPDGRWILTVPPPSQRSGREPGLFLVSSDGAVERQISQRGPSGRPVLGFSRDGRSVLYLEQNISGQGAPWRLCVIDLATGAERLVDVPLPTTAGGAAGFSLHPDGTRFLTSIANWPHDIWMLEGFDE